MHTTLGIVSRLPNAQRLAEWLLLLFVGFSVLWRGGKSIDATWLLAIVTVFIVCLPLLQPLLKRMGIPSEQRTTSAPTVPLWIWGTALLFLAWSLLSYLLSETRTYGLDEWVRDVSCVLLFLWILRRAGNQRMSSVFEGFLWVMTIAASSAVLFGLAVYVFQPVNRFTGTFLDWRFHTDYWPNAWAELTLLAWPLVALLALRIVSPLQRWVCTIATGCIVGSLLLSFSRGGIIAFLGQIVLLSLLWIPLVLRDVRVAKAAAERWRGMFAAGGVALMVALAFFVGGNALRSLRYDVESVSDKVLFQAAEGTSSINERQQFWEQAVVLSLERPWTGFGPYSFRFTQPHLMEHVLATSDHPHNVLLKYAAERGWPAAIAFGLFILLLIGLSLRHLFFDRKNEWALGKDARMIALIVATAGVLAHNMIDYNLQFVGLALPLWVALALLAVHVAQQRPVSRASFSHWRIARYFGRIEMLMIVLLVVVVTWEGVFLVVSSRGRHAEAQGNAEMARWWYERSEREWFSRDLFLARSQVLASEGALDEADRVLNLSLAENSVDARAWRMRAELALRRGHRDDAVAYATHAYRLARYTDAAILRVLLEASMSTEEGEKGMRARKEEFDALFRSFAEAIASNTHFIALSGNVEELQTIAVYLGMLFPTDAERYRSIADDALAHAESERATFAARPPGLLW